MSEIGLKMLTSLTKIKREFKSQQLTYYYDNHPDSIYVIYTSSTFKTDEIKFSTSSNFT